MDERLSKALEFSNYALTINNQKRNIRNRVAQLQIVHYLGGVFLANHETIAFIKTLIDLEHKSSIVIDSKQNPISVKSLKELLDKLLNAYTSATTEFDIENEKLKKARNIKKVMDW
jgi:hypothetical protein|tara:strand:- start:887 stop:1234 length:348 start_codon:yes stop_codon:yes gene_type:complete